MHSLKWNWLKVKKDIFWNSILKKKEFVDKRLTERVNYTRESRKFLNRDWLPFTNVIAHVWIFECSRRTKTAQRVWAVFTFISTIYTYIYALLSPLHIDVPDIIKETNPTWLFGFFPRTTCESMQSLLSLFKFKKIFIYVFEIFS